MEGFDFNSQKLRVKELYKSGKVQECLNVLEQDLLKNSKESKNGFDYAESLILAARIEMEFGMFPSAEAHLTELRNNLKDNEETQKKQDASHLFRVQCKYDHILAKVLSRSNYLQKSLDHVNARIKVLQNEKKENQIDEITRLKYICKLHEALAHLYCDPYMFTEGEAELNKAEKIYEENKDKLPVDLYRKFMIKKSSFQKKSGLFVDAYATLDQLELEITEDLQKQTYDQKATLNLKKLLFKVYRDQARLKGLRRQEADAGERYSKALKILEGDIYPNIKNNIKIAKLQLLKGLWQSKFSLDKSTEDLLDANMLFEELGGDKPNYFAANCQLEIGSNFLRQNDSSTANAFIYKAFEILKKCFTETHPLLQKYYSYASEVASHSDNIENMLSLVQQQLRLSETTNVKEDGTTSIFVLDPLVSYISLLSQARDRNEEVLEQCERVELICGENGIVTSTQLLHSANTMKSMVFIRKENLKEAERVLEESYEKQVKALKGNRAHPFLEHSISQLGLLYKVNQKFDKAEEMYGNVIKIKELYYGEDSETIIQPLKQLAVVQGVKKEFQLSRETFERAMEIAKKKIKEDPVKHTPKLGELLMDIYTQVYSLYESERNFKSALKIVDEQTEMTAQLYGNKSYQYAHACFLRAKTLMMIAENGTPDIQKCVDSIKQAIEIEEELQKDKPKNSILGRYLYCAGTIFQGKQDLKQALVYFNKSLAIIKHQPGLEGLTEELEKQIEMCRDELNLEDVEEGVETDKPESKVEAKPSNEGLSDILIAGAVGTVLVGIITYAVIKLRQQ